MERLSYVSEWNRRGKYELGFF